MTSRTKPRFVNASTEALNLCGGLPAVMALGGARPLDALALRLADKTCPEARFHLVRKMMGLRLRLTGELSAGFMACCHATTGQLLSQSSVIVPP